VDSGGALVKDEQQTWVGSGSEGRDGMNIDKSLFETEAVAQAICRSPEVQKPKYRDKVTDLDVWLVVGPYDKTLTVQVEYTRHRDDFTVERVWLGNFDITGYLSDGQVEQMRDELSNLI
jgi:hypothetical protein